MANSFASKVHDRFESRFAREVEGMSVTDWVVENTTLRGKPFSLKGYEFQRAILDDMHPSTATKKCSQVGLTEIQIRKALAFVKRNRGVSAIFTIAEEKLFKKVSQSRILPVVNHDPIFNTPEDEGAVRSMATMQFGHSFLYVTACTEGDATSTSADAIFKDEVDLSPQDMLALMSSRLQNSTFKIDQEFSTPSFPGFGIDSSYELTDQRQYLVRCQACNHWNWPKFSRAFIHMEGVPDHFEELIDLDATAIDDIDHLNSYVRCEKCRRALDLGNPELREWVAKYPNRHAHGYWVTPFCTDRLSVSYMVDQLLKYKKRQYVRGFHNTVLGEAYTDGQMQLSEQSLRDALLAPSKVEIGAEREVSVGVDMGQTCHIVVIDVATGAPILFHAVAVSELVEWLLKFDKEHKVVCGGIDRHPYTPTSNEIRDLFDGRIVPIEYKTSGPEFTLKVNNNKALSHVSGNRTTLLDLAAGRVRGGKTKFSGYGSYAETIVDHFRGMWRDEKPQSPAVWTKLHTRDHFFHAYGYALAGPRIKSLEESHEDSEPRSSVSTTVATQLPDRSDTLGLQSRPKTLGRR